jgi:SAM-dependent methyltransferase
VRRWYGRPVRLDAVGENLVERGIARTNLAPWPILHTQMAYTLARVLMAATRLGVFDALEDQPLAAGEIARRCSTDPHATEKLLFALAGAGYVQATDGGYALTARSRKWLRRDSPDNVADKLLLQFLEWEWMERSEDYVRSGQPFELHDTLPGDEWPIYQRGMRAMATPLASEFAKRLRVPHAPSHMLDIGGSHGYYSVLLCRRHPGLRAVVLDLPDAIEHAAPLLAAEGMGDRVVHQAGDALTDDLGVEAFDIVIASQLVHHFSADENRALAARVARALKPGGIYAIIDAFRPAGPNDAGQIGALMEFYFALTSQSGTWTPAEMASWQRDAGLRPSRPMKFRMTPGAGAQVGTKPS